MAGHQGALKPLQKKAPEGLGNFPVCSGAFFCGLFQNSGSVIFHLEREETFRYP